MFDSVILSIKQKITSNYRPVKWYWYSFRWFYSKIFYCIYQKQDIILILISDFVERYIHKIQISIITLKYATIMKLDFDIKTYFNMRIEWCFEPTLPSSFYSKLHCLVRDICLSDTCFEFLKNYYINACISFSLSDQNK